MSDLMNLYNYYREMAEHYLELPLDVEENRVKCCQFCILGDYVLREIEKEAM